MTFLELLGQLWPVLAAMGALFAWVLRLGWRMTLVERQLTKQWKAVESLEAKHADLAGRLADELSRIRESLARIEGRLDPRLPTKGSH